MNNNNSKIDSLLKQAHWHNERKLLRKILLDCQLEEEIKWGKLCYTFQGYNVVMIYGLKKYCALGFLKGVLLSDPQTLLVAPGEHSQAMRQIRFTDLTEINEKKEILKSYILNAIEIEKSGLTVDFREKNELKYPGELENILMENPELKKSFEALTPGRRRGYVLHFTSAKQSKTRTKRIEKCLPKIMQGKGFNER